MKDLSKRSTAYFEPKIHQASRIKASTNRSVSDVVNEAVRLALREDREDFRAFEDRADEATMTYEDLLQDLKQPGKL